MLDEPIAEKVTPFQRAARAGRGLWQGLVDVVTPPLCLACRAPVTRGAALCLACWQQLTLLEEPVCDALGTPFAYDEGEGALSPAAIAEPPPWRRGRAAVTFNDLAAHLVHRLKYQDTQEAGLAMARMMAAAGRALLAEADVLVPVPLHRRRLWQRRYNQAAVLAHAVSQASGVPVRTDVLLRVASTQPQVGLDAAARHKNVRAAFAVAAEHLAQVQGRRVLLIDDVRTTGATAAACTQVLLAAGAAQVEVLTFALVLQPARLHISG